MTVPRDGQQLSLFSDPRREWALALIEALEQNADKINELHDVMQKVLAGVPGYARPEHVRRMRLLRQEQRRVLGIGETALNACTSRHRRSRTRATGTPVSMY